MDQFCLSGRKEKQWWPFLEQAKRIPNGFCVEQKCWLKNKITNEITMTQIAREGDKRFLRADLKSSLKSPTWLLFGCKGPWGPVSCCSNHCPAILCFSFTCNALMYPHHFKNFYTTLSCFCLVSRTVSSFLAQLISLIGPLDWIQNQRFLSPSWSAVRMCLNFWL